MTNESKEAQIYWDQFYQTDRLGIEDIPSQFATFVIGEFSKSNAIIDIGCGNGRDSFFFCRHMENVVGVDASRNAVEHCNQKAGHLGLNNVGFHHLDLAGDGCLNFLEGLALDFSGVVAYARFLVHAIDEESEVNLLKMASFVSDRGGAVAFEFRTHRDENQKKETSTHYRRYINPLEFMENARSAGLNLAYFTEGFGFAKYKSDDAHVARLIFN